MTRQKTATILEPQTNRVSRNQRFLHSPLERTLINDLFLDLFLEKHSSNHSHKSNSTGIYMYKLSEVNFLGDKKKTNKRFLSGSLENRLSYIFVSSLTFELSQHTVFIFVKVCIYVRPRDAVN